MERNESSCSKTPQTSPRWAWKWPPATCPRSQSFDLCTSLNSLLECECHRCTAKPQAVIIAKSRKEEGFEQEHRDDHCVGPCGPQGFVVQCDRRATCRAHSRGVSTMQLAIEHVVHDAFRQQVLLDARVLDLEQKLCGPTQTTPTPPKSQSGIC